MNAPTNFIPFPGIKASKLGIFNSQGEVLVLEVWINPGMSEHVYAPASYIAMNGLPRSSLKVLIDYAKRSDPNTWSYWPRTPTSLRIIQYIAKEAGHDL